MRYVCVCVCESVQERICLFVRLSSRQRFVHVITVTQRDDDVRSVARSPPARLQPKHATAFEYTRCCLQQGCNQSTPQHPIHTFLPAARLQPKHATAFEYTRLCLQQGCNQSTPQHPNTHISACSKAATKARHSIRIHTFLPAARLQTKHATALKLYSLEYSCYRPHRRLCNLRSHLGMMLLSSLSLKLLSVMDAALTSASGSESPSCSKCLCKTVWPSTIHLQACGRGQLCVCSSVPETQNRSRVCYVAMM